MELRITDVDAMQSFGANLALAIDDSICINLIGDVGSGKTTFTKGFARGLGVGETVQSPTFTISRVYDLTDDRRMVHYDFYRLSEPGIMADELQENLDGGAVVVIEWGDIVADRLPDDSLTINISAVSEHERAVRCIANGERATSILERLTNVTSS